jgi:hypothetical protein
MILVIGMFEKLECLCLNLDVAACSNKEILINSTRCEAFILEEEEEETEAPLLMPVLAADHEVGNGFHISNDLMFGNAPLSAIA